MRLDYNLIYLIAVSAQCLGLTEVEAVYAGLTYSPMTRRVWYRLGHPEQPLDKRAWLADVYMTIQDN